MAQPIAPDYGQQFLFPPALEDWVPADHPAHFLREFVDQLDLPALGFVIPSGAEGRPPYATSLLLKIWLYGYFHRLRSMRKLEAACREQLALLWLTGLISPDHNSLYRLPAGLAEHQALREQVKAGLAQLASDGRNHHHPVEPEGRRRHRRHLTMSPNYRLSSGYCSFHFALHSNENLTTAQAGNSPTMIHQHCKGLATWAEPKSGLPSNPAGLRMSFTALALNDASYRPRLKFIRLQPNNRAGINC
jgi:hypothetical protein